DRAPGDGVLDGARARAPSGAREGPRPAHARRGDGRRRRHHHLAREAHPQEISRARSRVRRHRDGLRHGLSLDRAGVRRAALAGLALAIAGAADAAGGDPVWYLQLDNDVVFTTDRWYTSGVRIARLERDFEWALVQE